MHSRNRLIFRADWDTKYGQEKIEACRNRRERKYCREGHFPRNQEESWQRDEKEDAQQEGFQKESSHPQDNNQKIGTEESSTKEDCYQKGRKKEDNENHKEKEST